VHAVAWATVAPLQMICWLSRLERLKVMITLKQIYKKTFNEKSSDDAREAFRGHVYDVFILII